MTQLCQLVGSTVVWCTTSKNCPVSKTSFAECKRPCVCHCPLQKCKALDVTPISLGRCQICTISLNKLHVNWVCQHVLTRLLQSSVRNIFALLDNECFRSQRCVNILCRPLIPRLTTCQLHGMSWKWEILVYYIQRDVVGDDFWFVAFVGCVAELHFARCCPCWE